jgi:signal transduction histidine kinase
MTTDSASLYAALIHELKNELGLLSMALDAIPRHEVRHDAAVDAAQLQCQGVIERLQQALLVYKSASQPIHPVLDAWSPQDVVNEIADRACALARGRLRVESAVAPQVPEIGFFDRDLVEMALVNAVHNSLRYAQSRIRIEADMLEGGLAFIVRDDSPGYPEAILNGEAGSGALSAGTGLGLQFSRLIAQGHDNRGRRGELRLSNDAGAVFCLLLP